MPDIIAMRDFPTHGEPHAGLVPYRDHHPAANAPCSPKIAIHRHLQRQAATSVRRRWWPATAAPARASPTEPTSLRAGGPAEEARCRASASEPFECGAKVGDGVGLRQGLAQFGEHLVGCEGPAAHAVEGGDDGGAAAGFDAVK